MITALGLCWKSNAEGFRLGRTAFRPVTLFDVSRQRVKTAAEVDLPASLPPTHLSAREERRLTPAGKVLLLTGEQALREAGWGPPEKLPIVFGNTIGGISIGEAYYCQA